MAIAPLQGHVPNRHDIILYAVPGLPNAEDLKASAQWNENGATTITFASSAGLYRDRFPLDTVVNVIDLWTWTGEFVAACTRLGKMPVLYQTYGLPGGRDRGSKYQGKKFHDDLTIKPIPALTLGREYLDQIERMLASIENTQMQKMLQAAKWWAQASTAETLTSGHMFPPHVLDPRTPRLCNVRAVPAWEDKELLDTTNHPPAFVLYLGYQFRPHKLLNQAISVGIHLAYSDVQPAEPSEPATNILYIDPAWPLADGCVKVPGYDVPILPASGVIQAAIYWTIASLRDEAGH